MKLDTYKKRTYSVPKLNNKRVKIVTISKDRKRVVVRFRDGKMKKMYKSDLKLVK